MIVNWQFTPERSLTENIGHMRTRLMDRAFDGAQQMARNIEYAMKKNAAWKDQPADVHKPPEYPGPHAREGLFCRASRDGDVISVVAGFDPTVVRLTKKGRGRKYQYGPILESNEKYAIIVPTFQSEGVAKVQEMLTAGGKSLGFSGPLGKSRRG